jgi:hypothetical protein
MDKYIGLDVHATSCTAAIIDARGKKLGSHVIETNGQALVEFFKRQAGTLHVCMEEGTQSGWLAEILTPHVERLIVVHASESHGPKSDEHDAFSLAERLRIGRSRRVGDAKPSRWPSAFRQFTENALAANDFRSQRRADQVGVVAGRRDAGAPDDAAAAGDERQEHEDSVPA